MADITLDQLPGLRDHLPTKTPKKTNPKAEKPAFEEYETTYADTGKPKIHPGMFIVDRTTIEASARTVGVGFMAAVGAFCTFLVCTNLIDFSEGSRLDEEPTFRLIDVVEDIPDVAPRFVERQIEKMVEVEAPPEMPEVPTIVATDTTLTAGIDLSIRPARDLGRAAGPLQTMNMTMALPDGDYMPLVRIQPQYPRRALQKRVEGYVVIELTVAADGSVKNDSIRVMEAFPRGYFERAAMQAAEKFKYKPKVINGQSVDVPHVTYKFVFELGNVLGRSPEEQ